MKYFSYKSGCGIWIYKRIKRFNKELTWAIDKRFKVVSNIGLKDKAILSLKQYCMHVAMWSLVT